MSVTGQGVGQNNPMLMWQKLQAMMQPNQGSMNPPTTPFAQPPQAMGTTLNSMGSPSVNPTATPGQINPPQGAAAGPAIQNPLTGANMNTGGIMKGAQQLAGALAPHPAQMQPMQVPNLQVHQPGAGSNPQMLQQMLMSGRYGSPGGGGPFGDTQGSGYV